IAQAGAAGRAVVMGASFLGLEVAAARRARNIEGPLVAPAEGATGRIPGPPTGDLVRHLPEAPGGVFDREGRPSPTRARQVRLKTGGTIEAELVVVGVGVRPRLTLSEKAGFAIDRGVTVNQYLETSVPGIFAAGDIARWPDPHSGASIRVEHWVVAERQ